jgi:hypothetical protein
VLRPDPHDMRHEQHQHLGPGPGRESYLREGRGMGLPVELEPGAGA